MKKSGLKALPIAVAVTLALMICPAAAFADDASDLAAGAHDGLAAQADPGLVSMHRLYNPWTGEHFYTANTAERDGLMGIGWSYEGVGWNAPAKSNTPVYRLYNAYGAEHHYTMSADERDALVAGGWEDEGTGWFSDDAQAVPLMRDYNPNEPANNHNYTASDREHEMLALYGWREEGVAWYGAVDDNVRSIFTGAWSVSYMTLKGEEQATREQFELYRSWGYDFYVLNLNSDGTARMDAVDSDSFFGTWRPITETRATLTLDGYASDDLILENGELVMDEDDGDVIKYVKK